jgi:hypothetical protein
MPRRMVIALIVLLSIVVYSAASYSGTLSSDLVAYVLKPTAPNMVLPSTDPSSIAGRIGDTIFMTATPGEYEAASVVLRPRADLADLMLEATPLTAAMGAIPASSVDIRWVKCWYQDGGAWWNIVKRGGKMLVPELLLHDDSLVRVNDKQEDYLKITYPDGGVNYLWVSDPAPAKQSCNLRITPEQCPVNDSPMLLPTTIAANTNKQVWITVKVPDDARPGAYAGSINLTAGKRALGALRLKLVVLPFRLAEPKTYYDLKREFTYSIYYWGELDPQGTGIIGGKYKSEKQLLAELRDMYAHGVTSPNLIWTPDLMYDRPQALRRSLAIRDEAGMKGRTLYLGDSGLIGNPTDEAGLRKIREHVKSVLAVAREFGIPEVYFYGIDEARGDVLKSQRTAWQAVHEAGGKLIVSGYAGQFETVGDLLDLCNWSGRLSADEPAKWHSVGHRIWNYGNPQIGAENPDLYRRNYGLRLWRASYDGACDYCYMDACEGFAWNDFDDATYRDHNFVYPTVDGVIGTVAWEGFREGVDDVKYATTLRQAIEKADQSSDPAIKQTARAAQAYLDSMNLDGDLDTVRAGMIRYLRALSGRAR